MRTESMEHPLPGNLRPEDLEPVSAAPFFMVAPRRPEKKKGSSQMKHNGGENVLYARLRGAKLDRWMVELLLCSRPGGP